jgi:hypothetical protein
MTERTSSEPQKFQEKEVETNAWLRYLGDGVIQPRATARLCCANLFSR